jgi:hypothetical protein
MGNGLLAQWRRGIATRGFAGAALFAVPVAVAAAIGFGTSLSGVAGGLSSFANGPTTTTTADTSPIKLNRAVAAVASRQETNDASVPAGSNEGGGTTIVGDNVTGGGTTNGGGSGGSGGSGGTTDSTGSSGSTGGSTSTVSAPDVDLPSTDGGGTTGQVDNTVNTVDGVLDGVSNTVNGLLGQ